MTRLFLLLTFASATLHAQTTTGTPEDIAAITAIIHDASADKPNPHVSAQLDWENAFGVRYYDTAKRDAFYHEVVTPLQKDDTDSTLEIKVKFLKPDVAVADEYWHVVGQIDQATNKPGPDRWGRTTYIFTKANGPDGKPQWTEVMERVADLRSPWYKHYDEGLPKSVAVPPETLASYAGVYMLNVNKQMRTFKVEGDHLLYVTPSTTRVAIPTSAADFLLFDPRDTSYYTRVHFEKASDGRLTALLSDETEKPVAILLREK